MEREDKASQVFYSQSITTLTFVLFTENKPLFKEQPQVFSNTSSSVSNDQVKRRKGRTFDEIREENRRQQIQQAYPQTQQWMERQERQAEPEKQNRDKEIGVPG